MNAYPPMESGCLFVVATPIGNPEDITLRALRILRTVDAVLAEDTRLTGQLLAHHGIKARMVSYHEHNEREKTPGLVERLRSGAQMAIVTDAGTPSVSDPGYRIVSAAIECGISVVPVPGVSAAITALSVGGLPTDTFLFVGFLPRKAGKRQEQLRRLTREPGTLIFYESPRRIRTLVADIEAVMGDRVAALAREMTKPHEEFLRGSLFSIGLELDERPSVKGECTLLVGGYRESPSDAPEDMAEDIRRMLEEDRRRPADMVRELIERYGLSRNKAYSEVLRAQKERG